MDMENPSTTIQIRQDSNESGPYISNILHDYDDDETVTKKLAKYGYDNDVVDVKPAAAVSSSNQVAVTDSAPQDSTSPSVSTTTTTTTSREVDPIDMADAIREFALLKSESRALRNEIVRLQTELPRDLEVNSRHVTQDLESQVAAVISSQFQLSESQVTRATASEEGDQDTIVTDAAIRGRGESVQETSPQVEAALPEASPVVQAISATLVNSIQTGDENEPVYDARRVSYDGDETMHHHCQRIMKQNRKKLVGAGLILLLAIILVVLGVGGAFTSSDTQPLIVIPESNTANPSISHVPTSSSAPSTTQTPSIQPSTSISPTETCYWIDILIDYDDDPVSRIFPSVFLCPYHHLRSSRSILSYL